MTPNRRPTAPAVEGALGEACRAASEKRGRTLVLLMDSSDKSLPASAGAAGKARPVQLTPYGVEIVVFE